MQRANHNALIQATNQQLLSIRQAELTYYINFFSTFGAQSAVLGGFAYQAVTQISFSSRSLYIFNFAYMQEIYWCCSALCLTCAMHCILTTIFIQVFGAGMALHGPIGSVAKAVEGMKSETTEVFIAFILMTSFFGLSTMMSFWLVMDTNSASFGTALFCLDAMLVWHICNRVFNKFNYASAELEFDTEHRTSSDAEFGVTAGNVKYPNLRGQFDEAAIIRANKGLKCKDDVSCDAAFAAARAAGGPVMAGYMAKRDGSSVSAYFGTRELWTRRYFVLTAMGNLYYYKSKKIFEKDHRAAQKQRPIDLSEFRVISESRVVDASESVYEIRLEPTEGQFAPFEAHNHEDELGGSEEDHEHECSHASRHWVFRCDHESELIQWTKLLEYASENESCRGGCGVILS